MTRARYFALLGLPFSEDNAGYLPGPLTEKGPYFQKSGCENRTRAQKLSTRRAPLATSFSENRTPASKNRTLVVMCYTCDATPDSAPPAALTRPRRAAVRTQTMAHAIPLARQAWRVQHFGRPIHGSRSSFTILGVLGPSTGMGRARFSHAQRGAKIAFAI